MIDFIGNNVRQFTKCYSAVSILSLQTSLKHKREFWKKALDGRSLQKNNSVIYVKYVM